MTFRTLRADEIEAMVRTVKQNGCSVLLYKDSRCDMNLLDETVGPENWQRRHELIDGQLFCSVGIRVERADGTAEWVWKQDVGVESFTEKEKGRASDSFKRACFNIGCGRELYTAPFIWISDKDCNIQQKGQGYTTHDRFQVSEIGYDENRRINRLVITNKGKVVYQLGKPASQASKAPANAKEKPSDVSKDLISKTKVLALKAKADQDGVPENLILSLYKVKALTDLTEEMHTNIIQYWDRIKEMANGK